MDIILLKKLLYILTRSCQFNMQYLICSLLIPVRRIKYETDNKTDTQDAFVIFFNNSQKQKM